MIVCNPTQMTSEERLLTAPYNVQTKTRARETRSDTTEDSCTDKINFSYMTLYLAWFAINEATPGAHRAGEGSLAEPDRSGGGGGGNERSGSARLGEGACNSVYCQRHVRRQNSNMADFLLCLVSTVTIFSSTILLWLKKAAMFEFCRIRSYMRLRQLDELLATPMHTVHVVCCQAPNVDSSPYYRQIVPKQLSWLRFRACTFGSILSLYKI